MAAARKSGSRVAERVGSSRDGSSREGSGGDGGASRQRLLDAAVACILDKGYYRASSNEIARRAGVTWGVIQYHFGTRERLMLAVFEDACQKLIDNSKNAKIVGDTVEEQLSSYFANLMTFYGRPEYLAYLEISLNLTRDPEASAETMEALRRLRDELPAHHPHPRSVPKSCHSLVFESLRGLILSHLLRIDGSVTALVDDEEAFEERARMLIESLAAFVEAHRDDAAAAPQAG
jgi:AcrR family transcriptional regulator